MTNFVFLKQETGEISLLPDKEDEEMTLKTHCPIMRRSHYCQGETYQAKLCRCDIVPLKMEIHSTRCSSAECTPRKYLESLHTEATVCYEIIPQTTR
jgi:hypothetical protein